jgi:protease-4
MRRRVSLWRIAAVVLGVIALIAVFAGGDGGSWGVKQQIARITVEGVITDDRKRLEMLDEIARADHVAAVILAINSPGGTTTGGEALYLGIRELAAKKPVVAVMGTMATSAGYMIALGTDRIVARGNTITGSVGVIFQFPEVSVALDKLGIKMHEIRSGPLKATPSPFQPLDPAGKALAEELVQESKEWFTGLVAERRKLALAAVPGLTDGRIYSGRQALKLKLIDAIGGEAEARAWLERDKGISEGLEIVDWRPRDDTPWSLFGSASSLAGRLLGLRGEDLARFLGVDAAIDGLTLDGLVSVWHGHVNS